jgi:hypothetical protein
LMRGRSVGSGAAGYYRPRRLRARGAASERQQRDVTGAFDGFAEPALMPGADARHAARENLAALLHELRKDVRALVVDEVHLLDAKLADLLFAEVLALSATGSAGTSWTTATWATFATRATVTTAWAAVSTAGTPVAAFAAGCASRSLCLLLFLCHTCLPFGLLCSICLRREKPQA